MLLTSKSALRSYVVIRNDKDNYQKPYKIRKPPKINIVDHLKEEKKEKDSARRERLTRSYNESFGGKSAFKDTNLYEKLSNFAN